MFLFFFFGIHVSPFHMQRQNLVVMQRIFGLDCAFLEGNACERWKLLAAAAAAAARKRRNKINVFAKNSKMVKEIYEHP